MTRAMRSLLVFQPGPDTIAVLLICTHRGDGRKVVDLGFVSWDPDDDRGVVVHDFGHARSNATSTTTDSGAAGIAVRCGKCNRHWRRRDTLAELVRRHGGTAEWRGDTLHAMTLDLSEMD